MERRLIMHRTVLHAEYKEYAGVKMTDFGGWELPLHYAEGIIGEHHAVRQRAGLFDISHMGRCMVSGEGAADYLDYLVTNNVASMEEGQIIYTLMCYPNGTVVDDLIIYKFSEHDFWVVMNASNTKKDLLWMQRQNPKAAAGEPVPRIEDFTAHTVQLALQGPLAERILTKLTGEAQDLAFFRFVSDVEIAQVRCLLSRNGYTGEDGFEMYCDNEHAPALWNALLKAGESEGLIPCGLGSRDTLRLEAKLPLYGNEISDEITPLEANLGVFVKLDKHDFCGKEALTEQHLKGIPRSLRGVEMVDSAVPRHGQPVFLEDRQIGFVTSGTKSPTLGIFCGYVLIERSLGLSFGDFVEIEIHGKRKRAKLVKTPFYKRTPQRG
jgi:aminomethyltransferase